MRSPSSAFDNNDLERLARRRAGAKLGWYIHAMVFVLVNAGLACLSMLHGRHAMLGSAFGWGLGLLVHGLCVFVLPRGGRWREALVQRERDQLRKQHGLG